MMRASASQLHQGPQTRRRGTAGAASAATVAGSAAAAAAAAAQHRSSRRRFSSPQLLPARNPLPPRQAVSGATEAAVLETERRRRESVLSDARAFLDKELCQLFAPGGEVTRARYAADVTFEDPVTKISGLDAYVLLVRALKAAFQPDFTLHALEATGADELTAVWTMTANVPLLPWRPVVPFTGRSVYKVDLATGLVTSHVDTWDAVTGSNAFPSLEAAALLARRALDATQVPDGLETPRYEVLRAAADYEVRRYDAFTVAEAPVSPGGTASGGGFNELARYIFGGNEGATKMEMTSPVFTQPTDDGSGSRMAFVMGEQQFADPAALPAPLDARITARRVAPRLVAAARFSGWAFDWDVAREERALRAALLRDGLRPQRGFSLARYNDPSVPPPLRRNEVLIDLEAGSFEWPPRLPPAGDAPAAGGSRVML